MDLNGYCSLFYHGNEYETVFTMQMNMIFILEINETSFETIQCFWFVSILQCMRKSMFLQVQRKILQRKILQRTILYRALADN